MSETRMHSLSFALRHRDDLVALCESGRDAPSGIAAEDWAKLWTVSDAAVQQAERCLDAVLAAMADELRQTPLRFSRVSRNSTLQAKWEGWGHLTLPRARSPVGSLGGSLGLDGTSLSIWWGFHRSRSILGPRFAELLRENGCTDVRVEVKRRGVWMAGTVVVAELDLATPRTEAECMALARRGTRSVAALAGTLRELG